MGVNKPTTGREGKPLDSGYPVASVPAEKKKKASLLLPGKARGAAKPSGFFIRRGGAEAKRLYDYRWQRESKRFLVEHPLCQCPSCGEGRVRVRAASVVDHKRPHRGDRELFWDRSNWQAMAKRCHDSYKQRLEKSGRVIGADASGRPVDPRHHWNR